MIALFGDLGAGKTTLTKGIAVGLGLAADIHSPTFTLIHEHPGAVPLYHVDLYRLSCEEEIETLGLEEYIYSDGVTIIEWADRMKSLLPPDTAGHHAAHDRRHRARADLRDRTPSACRRIIEGTEC